MTKELWRLWVMTKIELTPAFLIHRRMYQGSSLLLDFFTCHYGKIRLVARGARSNKTSLQMFQCLNISYRGRSDLKNLTNWESSDQPRRLLGNDLILAMYTNELLSRLLPEAEKHQKIFDGYWNFLRIINEQAETEKEYSLRLFENLLLEELGLREYSFSVSDCSLIILKKFQYPSNIFCCSSASGNSLERSSFVYIARTKSLPKSLRG